MCVGPSGPTCICGHQCLEHSCVNVIPVAWEVPRLVVPPRLARWERGYLAAKLRPGHAATASGDGTPM